MNDKANLGSPTQGDTVSNFTEHIRDHWAVRGCGDLPPWGGVYILKREWLEYEENNNKVRTITPVGDVSGGLNLPGFNAATIISDFTTSA